MYRKLARHIFIKDLKYVEGFIGNKERFYFSGRVVA